jgi:uncharacterized protein YdeI (YjbR/CyaY-like superfamily)
MTIIAFASASEFASWLKTNHAVSSGVWVEIAKKGTGRTSVSYDKALDVALSFGWIDGQKKSKDAKAWLQRFTPRRSRSLWSKRNRERAEHLIRSRKMKASGLREVEQAKRDGRWDAAYDSPSRAEIPDDFVRALAKNKKAKAFFDTLNKANRYAIAWRLQTARKPETRQRRLHTILDMMAQGRKFH